MTGSSTVVSPELLAAALDAADAEERRQATSLIAELFLHDALPLLIRALGDADWRVRKEATYAARAFVPAPKLVEAMIALFEPGENVGLRNAAVDVLGSCGSAATRPLAMAFAGLDADGRKLAVQALGSTRDPQALAVLSHALDDRDSNVRQGAVEAISRLGPFAPSEVQLLLLRSLDGHDPFCQLAALEGLNALGVAVPWDKLHPLLDHPTLRAAALTSACSAEDARAAASIVHILRSARGNTFLLAVAALARMAEGPLLAEVTIALEAEDAALGERLLHIANSVSVEPPHHRGSALLLAAIAAAPGVVDAAAHALEDELLGDAATQALRVLGPKVLPDLIRRIAPTAGSAVFSVDVRAALIEASAAIAHGPCPPDVLRLLVEALRSATLENDRRVTPSALCALSRLGEDRDLELAAKFVGSSSKPIAHAAEAALAILTKRHPDAARRIAESLTERAVQGSADDACTAVVMIGALAARSSASRQSSSPDMVLLTRCAAAEQPRVRRAAMEALALLGGESALRILSLALTDDAREVQLAAARSLGVLGRTSCFRPPNEPDVSATSLRVVMDLVMRSADVELVATAIRSVAEDLEIVAGDMRSTRAATTLLSVFAPLAREADGTIAMAAIEVIGRLPRVMKERQPAIAAALVHPDDTVVKAAMLKLDTTGLLGTEILQCLDHPSHDVRSLAAEIMAGSDNPALRRRLAERTSVELDLNMRDTLEGALSSIPWRGERGEGGT